MYKELHHMLYSVHSYKSASALGLYNLLAKTPSRQNTQEIAYIQMLPIFKLSLRYLYEEPEVQIYPTVNLCLDSSRITPNYRWMTSAIES